MSIYYGNQLSYNEPWLLRTGFAGPELFVITEFHCNYFNNNLLNYFEFAIHYKTTCGNMSKESFMIVF